MDGSTAFELLESFLEKLFVDFKINKWTHTGLSRLFLTLLRLPLFFFFLSEFHCCFPFILLLLLFYLYAKWTRWSVDQALLIKSTGSLNFEYCPVLLLFYYYASQKQNRIQIHLFNWFTFLPHEWGETRKISFELTEPPDSSRRRWADREIFFFFLLAQFFVWFLSCLLQNFNFPLFMMKNFEICNRKFIIQNFIIKSKRNYMTSTHAWNCL